MLIKGTIIITYFYRKRVITYFHKLVPSFRNCVRMYRGVFCGEWCRDMWLAFLIFAKFEINLMRMQINMIEHLTKFANCEISRLSVIVKYAAYRFRMRSKNTDSRDMLWFIFLCEAPGSTNQCTFRNLVALLKMEIFNFPVNWLWFQGQCNIWNANRFPPGIYWFSPK